MCGFCGYINKNESITNDKLIKQMNDALKFRGPNASDVYIDEKVAIGHSRLSIIDLKGGTQPMYKTNGDEVYVIAYNGELYGSDNLRSDLISKGYDFITKSDTEVVLTAFIEYGEKCLDYLNGIFAFCIYNQKTKTTFIARDRLGIKPLFYTITDDSIVFASEIKAILKHSNVKAILDKNGLMELIGLGPAHTLGKTYFKNILEVKPGCFAYIKDFVFEEKKYWDLTTKPMLDDENTVIKEIHDLVVDSTKKQLVSDVKLCTMLSGGLDSSILSKIANDNVENLTTFSIDYVGNDKNFVSNDYQLSKDSDYIKIMSKYLGSNHKNIIVENSKLFDFLQNSMIARDMPGMGDIDSAMYIFCNNISNNDFKVCLSGECSDEIFGGYPWFYKEHLISHDGFPWALSENLRNSLVKKGILKDGELSSYVENARQDTLKNVVHLDSDDEYQRRFRNTNYLTVKWFMNTLIERTDRMSMANSLEVRVPFADYRIFEYVYNIPARMKLGISKSGEIVEKYLLRKAFEKELPEDVIYRKKSPFPKTYDPTYLSLVENKVTEISKNKDLKIHKIINFEYIDEILQIHGENLTENLFGQLMTYPQTLAYIIQISDWLELYDIEIDI